MHIMGFKRNEVVMDDCVYDTVKQIIKAQNQIAEERHHYIDCEQSIKQLLTPAKKNKHDYNTIPFILYTKDHFKPFIANGIYKAPIEGYPGVTFFDLIETPFLKALDFVKGSDRCVRLELLRPVNANGFPVADRGDKLSDFFHRETPFKTIFFRETGICITVDLNCFSGITCLDPIKPLPPYHKTQEE